MTERSEEGLCLQPCDLFMELQQGQFGASSFCTIIVAMQLSFE